MAAPPVPYPPSPKWIPADLTDLDEDSIRDSRSVLTALVLFAIVYVTLLLGCLATIVLGLVIVTRYFGVCVGLPITLLGGVFAFQLITVLFHRPPAQKELSVEVTEDDHPVLFAFLRKLAREIGTRMPRRVYVVPEVNAAVVTRLTLANMIFPPRRDLHIGLGLVNVLTLSEFKAVIGHEFGHFAQKSGAMHVRTQLALRILESLKGGDDWVSREMKALGRAAPSEARDTYALFFAIFVGGPVWCVAKIANGLFHLVGVSSLALSRSHEFHADRVAVSVAGSNAIVHGLAKLNFAGESLSEAYRVLDGAAEHNLHSRDLYFHHTAAAERLRRTRRQPRLGLPPVLRSPAEGQHVQVFEDKDDDDRPLMWRTHPYNFDREENAKKVFVPADDDDRLPWILFDKAADLRERMTYRFYRVMLRAKKSIRMLPARDVQGFIDKEQGERAFDSKYRGAFDDRWIDPGRLFELNAEIEKDPWEPARLTQVHSRLYREIGRRAETLRDLHARIREVYRKAYGRPEGRAARKIREMEEDLEDVVDWFKSFDRRVYLVHAQMAEHLGTDVERDLKARYSFQMEVQNLHRNMVRATQRVEDAMTGVQLAKESMLPPDFFEWVREGYQAGRKTMIDCLRRARELQPPAIPGVPPRERFDRAIFDQEVLDEPPLRFIRGRWVYKLQRQMNRMRARLRRVDFQSLGELLRVQDRIAAEWFKQASPNAIQLGDEPESTAAPDIAP